MLYVHTDDIQICQYSFMDMNVHHLVTPKMNNISMYVYVYIYMHIGSFYIFRERDCNMANFT